MSAHRGDDEWDRFRCWLLSNYVDGGRLVLRWRRRVAWPCSLVALCDGHLRLGRLDLPRLFVLSKFLGLVILLYRSRSRRGAGGGEKGSRQAVPVR